jgi:hypothetical protein
MAFVQLGVNVFRDVLLTAQLRQLFNGLKYCATLLKPGMNLRSAILSLTKVTLLDSAF